MKRQMTLWVVAAGLLAGCPSSGDDLDGGGGTDARTDGQVGGDQGRPDMAVRDAGGRDAGPGDAGRDAAPVGDEGVSDGGPASPTPEQVPPRLFDAQAGGIDATLAAVVETWLMWPSDEASARGQASAALESRRQLEAAGPAAADRIVEICDAVPVSDVRQLMVCLRLLGLVESNRSLDYLATRARLVVPPWPEGAHPIDPAPQDLARRLATWALEQRARAGSELALEVLLRLVADPNNQDRSLAVKGVFGALPRVRAKARLRAALPPDELYRLYEQR